MSGCWSQKVGAHVVQFRRRRTAHHPPPPPPPPIAVLHASPGRWVRKVKVPCYDWAKPRPARGPCIIAGALERLGEEHSPDSSLIFQISQCQKCPECLGVGLSHRKIYALDDHVQEDAQHFGTMTSG